MKVILLFALFGLSFYQVSGDENCPPTKTEYKSCKVTSVKHGNSHTCLQQAMEESAEFFKAVNKFVCEYRSCKKGGDYNYDNYKAAAREMTEIMKCIGCEFDLLLGTDNFIEELLDEVSQVTAKVGALAIGLVESLGVAEEVAEALCIVLNDVLDSDCVQKKLKKTVPETTKNMCDMYCNGNKYSTKKAASNIADALRETGCDVAGLMPPGRSLENLLETAGGLVSSLAGTIVEATEQIPLDKGLVCSVLNGGGIDELLAGLKKGLLGGVLQGVLGGVKGLLGGLLGGSI